MSEVTAMGFLPPGFDQNEDTYMAIDNLGFDYDAGVQAGLIYAPGHGGDVWPYQVEGYNFSAVPISTVDVYGELTPLYDKKMADNGMSAAECNEILTTKLDESAANDEPIGCPVKHIFIRDRRVFGRPQRVSSTTPYSEDTIFANQRGGPRDDRKDRHPDTLRGRDMEMSHLRQG